MRFCAKICDHTEVGLNQVPKRFEQHRLIVPSSELNSKYYCVRDDNFGGLIYTPLYISITVAIKNNNLFRYCLVNLVFSGELKSAFRIK